jgi:hypothetical protein
MDFNPAHRPPLFAEGVRKEVLAAWGKQGMPKGASLQDLFVMDERDEFEPDFWPRPYPRKWPNTLKQVETLARRLNLNNPPRLTREWKSIVDTWPGGDMVRMLFVHHGFFETVGVDSWRRLKEVVLLLKHDQAVVKAMLETQGEFNARLIDRVLDEVQFDAAIFSEPIGDNNGPLISPQTYRALVLPSYQPILDVLRRHGVATIILRTYANCRVLIPALLDAGLDCLWAVEVYGQGMDYRDLRKEFGPGLRLIGGIDLDVLRQGMEAIRREIEEKVPPLVAQGGYIPLADGRVRVDVPWENYQYYRELLQEVVQKR